MPEQNAGEQTGVHKRPEGRVMPGEEPNLGQIAEESRNELGHNLNVKIVIVLLVWGGRYSSKWRMPPINIKYVLFSYIIGLDVFCPCAAIAPVMFFYFLQYPFVIQALR